MKTNFKKTDSINLNDKINMFIKWYYENMIKDNYSCIGEYQEPRKMRNLIEKMAVWYELRYPDYEVNRLMPGSGQESRNINDIMFKNNEYVNDLFDANSDVRLIDWNEFYNADAFIKSLPFEERYLFDEPKYNSIVYFKPNGSAHLHLTKDGFVKMAESVSSYTYLTIREEQLIGLHINDVVELFKRKNIKLPKDNELEKEIEKINKWKYQKEEMLNCVMYRIIERGGNRIGPRRAFLFAKEFKRNIDIPMMYAVDHSDPGLRLFANNYIKSGGSKDLVCYENYFWKTNKSMVFSTTTVQQLILTEPNNAASFYTPEETELHQRLANALGRYVDSSFAKENELQKIKKD